MFSITEFIENKIINPIKEREEKKYKLKIQKEANQLICVEKYPNSKYLVWRRRLYSDDCYNEHVTLLGEYNTFNEAKSSCVSLRNQYVESRMHDMHYPHEPYRVF